MMQVATKRLVQPPEVAPAVSWSKTFCEFFAGIGLVRKGLEASGWRCLYANDISEQKEELYRLNFRDAQHFHRGDVWDTASITDRIVGAPFLATASFPCVDLSLAGHWRGFDGDHSSTFFGFTKVIGAMRARKPRVIMLENVTGFITSRSGSDFGRAANELANYGYYLDAFVLDARHFVPQSRPRVFVIGIHRSLKPASIYPARNDSLFSILGDSVSLKASAFRPLKLLDAMRKSDIRTGWIELPLKSPDARKSSLESNIDLDEKQEWWSKDQVDKHCGMMSELHSGEVKARQKAGGLHVGTIYRRKRHGSTKAEVRFDGLAGCLRTPRGGSARQIVIVISGKSIRMRWMSPREYARLQGAPSFRLVENKNQNLFAFGDAVCVPVIRWIDRCVLTPIYKTAKDTVRNAG